MSKEIFGKRIKELRIMKNLSQDSLAELTGIDRAQISKIEKGKINVTLETIEKLSAALCVSASEILREDNLTSIHPFVKWAGGKTQILTKIKDYMPKSYNNYYEPFVGGGALLFSLAPKVAFINDQNTELICAYRCFCDNELFEKLKECLKQHEAKHSESYYYEVRKMDQEINYNDRPLYERAARMIYLNKACFNGLYRVNSKGFFNVPSGQKEKVTTFENENFDAIKDYFLNNSITISNVDFEQAITTAKEGDFVYFDPPYDVYPNKSGFVDYGKNGFDKKEQIRLCECFKKLSQKGVKVMLSNHNTEFINELYNDFTIHVINAKRMINSKSDGRGNVEEVIITNYE